MNTLVSYGVVILGVTAYILYASPQLRKKALAFLPQAPAQTAFVPADLKKAAKTKSKSKPKPAKTKGKEPQVEVPAPDHTTPEAIREEEEEDATEFAKRMHKAQTGESLQKEATASDKPAKKKGKNKKNKGEQSNSPATPSDDGSASLAPTAKAAEVVSSVSETLSGAAGMATDIGKKVVDTLNINQPRVPAPVPEEDGWTLKENFKRNKDKSAQQEETKKQRQREAKKQAEKELNAETERLRKKKLEEQLRTARIARGEAARNGESYQEAPIPKRSAWGKSNSQEQSSGMLDTLDVSHTSSGMPSETRSTPVIIASDHGFEEVNGTGMPTRFSSAKPLSPASDVLDMLMLQLPAPFSGSVLIHPLSRSDGDLPMSNRSQDAERQRLRARAAHRRSTLLQVPGIAARLSASDSGYQTTNDEDMNDMNKLTEVDMVRLAAQANMDSREVDKRGRREKKGIGPISWAG